MMQQTKLKTNKKGQNSFYSNDTFHFKFYLLTETFCVQESSSIEVGNTRMIMILICNLYVMDIMLTESIEFDVSGTQGQAVLSLKFRVICR